MPLQPPTRRIPIGRRVLRQHAYGTASILGPVKVILVLVALQRDSQIFLDLNAAHARAANLACFEHAPVSAIHARQADRKIQRYSLPFVNPHDSATTIIETLCLNSQFAISNSKTKSSSFVLTSTCPWLQADR